MYVKAIYSEQTQIFDVKDDEVTTGYEVFWGSVSAERVMEYLKLDPITTVVRFMGGHESNPSIESEGKSGWLMSFAYWWDWEKGFLRLITTQGKIYILGDKGQTIDRVN